MASRGEQARNRESSDDRLNEASLRKFLAVLDPDPTAAAFKYALLHRKLEFFFRVRNCEPAAAELADITLNRVITRFFEDEKIRTADPRMYAYGVARWVLREHARKQTPLAIEEDVVQPAMEDAAREALHQHLEYCLAGLSVVERQLAIEYYSFAEKIKDRKAAAAGSGKSQETIRVQLYRIRQKLKACIESRMRQNPMP